MSNRDQFTVYFREVQPKFSRLFTIILSKIGLTLPQYALLTQLAVDGTLPMTQVSRRLHISKPAVTNLVDRLEKNKCLSRIPHPKDRRIYLLELQPKGEKIVRKVQSEVLNVLLQTLSQFSAKERMTINRFYASLSQTLGIVLSEPQRKKK